jgi:hypothetical protein
MNDERTFDWSPRHDERSRAFPIRSLLLAKAPRKRRLWTPGPILDQGREGACVGHAWANEAMSSPVRVDLTRAELPGTEGERPWPRDAQALAFALYRQAQRIDEWAGEAYSGTSVLAGAKVMASLRFVRQYRWAFGVDDVIDTLVQHGPVVLGINWYYGMYTAPGGEVQVTGQRVGGHAILTTGYDPERSVNGKPPREMVRWTNTWGVDYGDGGSAWISTDDLSRLLSEDGEACVSAVRSYGRPNPRKDN